MQFLGEAKDQVEGNPVVLVPFIFSARESRVLEFGAGYFRVWMNDQLVMKDGSVYEVATDYTEVDIKNLRFAQSADLVFIASENHAPKKIGRYADDDWRIQEITFVPKVSPPTGVKATQTAETGAQGKRTYAYTVTSIDADTGEESLAAIASIISDAWNLSSLVRNDIAWNAATGNILEYRVYRKEAGVYGFVGRVSDGLTFEDNNIKADTEDTPPSGDNPFASDGDYPAVVNYWQQRIMWASSKKRPLTVWGSPSAQFESMAAGVPPSDSDAVELTLATPQANRIMWLEGDRTLCMGTAGDEWNVGKADEAFTPRSSLSKQGGRGSAFLPALFAGSSLLFVQRGGQVVREFVYQFSSDKYESVDLTLLSSHLFDGEEVVDWAYQQIEAPFVWVVMASGELRCMTYDKQQSVMAWHSHATDGVIESICSIPHDEGDEIYLSVIRDINGTKKRYIEKLGELFLKSNDPETATMIDSFKYFDSIDGAESLKEIVGLEHLEGKDVLVWEDGSEQGPFKVVGGKIELKSAVKHATVGLEYESILSPFRPEVPVEDGASLMRKYSIKSASVSVYKTLGGKIGKSEDRLEDILKHNAVNPIKPEFATKGKEIAIGSGFDEEWTFTIKASGAAPMTIQALTYAVDIGDK